MSVFYNSHKNYSLAINNYRNKMLLMRSLSLISNVNYILS